MAAGVTRRPQESFDSLLKRFNQAVAREGILADIRKRSYYEKPSERRHRKRLEAIRRQRRQAARNAAD